MQAIQTFLANYSANFSMALILWPALSLLLTLPILAYLYHRDGRLQLTSIIGTYLTVLYLLGLGCFTLYPLPDGTSGPGITYGIEPNFNPLNFINDIRKEGLRAVFEILANVVFFVPLGFIAGRLWRLKLPTTVLVGALTSICIEMAQLTGLFGIYSYAYRCCDITDMVTNTLGAVIGWLGAYLFSRLVPEATVSESLAITRRPSLLRRLVALWVDVTLIWIITVMAYSLVTFLLSAFDNRWLPEMLANSSYSNGDLLGLIWLITFAILEIIVPWCNHGSTLGGAFVRMTCESRLRTVGWRMLFYLIRTVVILALLWPPTAFFAVPIIAVFYLVNRRMPQDLLP